MPRLTGNKLPKLRLHKPTGKAVVTICGRHHYCGKFGSAESQRHYNKLLAEWLANGRNLPPKAAARNHGGGTSSGITIVELCERYLDDRRIYFAGPYGKPSRSYHRIKIVVKLLLNHYPALPAEQFGALKLRALRESLITTEVSRGYVNEMASAIRTMFKWACSLELVPPSVYQSLCTVPPLQAGKTIARESTPIGPIDDVTLEATIAKMAPIHADMVRLQRFTGMRPGEVVLLRPCDLDTSRETWLFRPMKHKMQHKGRERTVPI